MTPPAVRALDARVPLRDGVHLATDVVVLDDGARHPVLLVRTPYSRASLREAYDVVGLARSGWAVVLQDVRGRIDSEGQFRPFVQEVDDGYDVVSWCAAQSWSNGRVAMTGASYNGAAQWLAAVRGHPALRAISPAVIGSDLRDQFAYQGGAWEQGFLSGWAVALAASGTDPELQSEALAVIPEWPEVLRAADADARFSRLLPEYAAWRADEEAWWKAAAVPLEDIQLPAWHLTGWYDLFCEGTLDTFAVMAGHDVPQRLLVGPWSHVNLYQQLVGEIDFGPAAHGLSQGLPAQMHAFLRGALEGEELQSGVAVFVMDANEWREIGSWPPPSTPYRLCLGSSGTLTTDRWRHDPADPFPTHGGRTLLQSVAGPVDQRPVQSRDDVAVWVSDALEADLTIIGRVMAVLALTSTAAQTDVCVTLCDVHPDGRSVNVVDGVLRTTGTPGEPREVELRVGSTAMTFRASHRIALAVSAASWPRFDLSPIADIVLHLERCTLTLPIPEGS